MTFDPAILVIAESFKDNDAYGPATWHKTKPAQAQVGDLMLFHMVSGLDGDSFTFTPPSGFTLIWGPNVLYDGIWGNIGIGYWGYRIVDGTEPADYTGTLSSGGSDEIIAISVFRGVDVAAPINDTSAVGNNTTCPPCTTTVDNCLIYSSISAVELTGSFSGADCASFPAGVTEILNHAITGAFGPGLAAGTAVQAIAGDSPARTFTLLADGVLATVVFSIAIAPGALPGGQAPRIIMC